LLEPRISLTDEASYAQVSTPPSSPDTFASKLYQMGSSAPAVLSSSREIRRPVQRHITDLTSGNRRGDIRNAGGHLGPQSNDNNAMDANLGNLTLQYSPCRAGSSFSWPFFFSFLWATIKTGSLLGFVYCRYDYKTRVHDSTVIMNLSGIRTEHDFLVPKHSVRGLHSRPAQIYRCYFIKYSYSILTLS
jgi:hypothetical protein